MKNKVVVIGETIESSSVEVLDDCVVAELTKGDVGTKITTSSAGVKIEMWNNGTPSERITKGTISGSEFRKINWDKIKTAELEEE